MQVRYGGDAVTWTWTLDQAKRLRTAGWSWLGGTSCAEWTSSTSARSGFAASPDCPARTSGSLPLELTVSGKKALIGGVTWYQRGEAGWSDFYTNQRDGSHVKSVWHDTRADTQRWDASFAPGYGGGTYAVTLPR